MLTDGGFEEGAKTWDTIGSGIYLEDNLAFVHSGVYSIDFAPFHSGQTLSQHLQVPRDRPFLTFWSKATGLGTDCSRSTAIIVVSPNELRSIQGFCLGGDSTWQRKQVDMSAYAGQVINLEFTMLRSLNDISSWYIDDISFEANNKLEPTATPRDPRKCSPAYPTVCIPPPPPDLNCDDILYSDFKVLPPDPHHFDTDGDGIGCETR